jgi:hypothetical protein
MSLQRSRTACGTASLISPPQPVPRGGGTSPCRIPWESRRPFPASSAGLRTGDLLRIHGGSRRGTRVDVWSLVVLVASDQNGAPNTEDDAGHKAHVPPKGVDSMRALVIRPYGNTARDNGETGGCNCDAKPLHDSSRHLPSSSYRSASQQSQPLTVSSDVSR